MKLAFVIFRYFPYGGLQRDMLALAEYFQKEGHHITVFCERWEGDKPPAIDVKEIAARGIFNTAGVKGFVENFQRQFARTDYDALIGFNKMPGLDVYFAGDTCFAYKAYSERNWLYRQTPRSRLYLRYERAVFGEESETKILSLVPTEQKQFVRFYGTPPDRFYPLPPGIIKAHIACDDPAAAYRNLRAELELGLSTKIILCLGSGFHTKGLDISLKIFAEFQQQLEDSALVIVGNDKPGKFRGQAQSLGIERKVFFLGPRSPIGHLLHAVDLLLHPARKELAGNAIIEAMLCGCPVLASDHCGFAFYITDYHMGGLIYASSTPKVIAQQLENLLQQEKTVWRERATIFQGAVPVFERAKSALVVVEKIVTQKKFGLAPCAQELKDSQETKKVTASETLILRDEFVQLWKDNASIFDTVRELPGHVAREMPDRQTLRFELDGKFYYRKWHRGVGWGEILKNLVRFRLPILGARNEWAALNKMRALEIPGLIPVAFGERGKNPARQQSFVVTRELSEVLQLDHFFQNHAVHPKLKRALIVKVAKISRELHGAGINHRDFYLCHFMVGNSVITNLEAEPHLTLVDLHRAQLRPQVPERWRVKDIGSLLFSSLNLGFSRRDYYRFLAVYFSEDLRSILQHRTSLIQKIVTRARKTYRRDFGHWPNL